MPSILYAFWILNYTDKRQISCVKIHQRIDSIHVHIQISYYQMFTHVSWVHFKVHFIRIYIQNKASYLLSLMTSLTLYTEMKE
jgi:hypothetical protein